MSDSSTNLSKSEPKVFEKTTEFQPPQVPSETAVDQQLSKDIGKDIVNLANQDVANVETDLLYAQFVDKIKEFLDSQDSQNTISASDEKLEEIKSTVEDMSLDKNSLTQAVTSIDSEEIKANKPAEVKLEVTNELIQQITTNILGIINFNTIVKSTVEHTVTSIKSLIDANAGKFKKTLETEMNAKLEVNKLKKLDSESGEKLLDQETPNEDESEDAELEATLAEDVDIEGEGEVAEEEQPMTEADADAEKVPETKPTEKKEDDKKKDDPLKTLPENQKKVELKQKKSLLETDKMLGDVNKYLKKLIEKQDVVEEYDARKTSEADANSDKKKNEKEEKPEKDKGSMGKKLGLGMLMGSLVAMLVMFRASSSHSSLQNYIAKHGKDADGKSVTSDINNETKTGEDTMSKLSSLLGKGEDEMRSADKEVDDELGEIKEADGQIDESEGGEESEVGGDATGSVPEEDIKTI